MKTAKEWRGERQRYLEMPSGPNAALARVLTEEDWVRAIQADALEAAAKECERGADAAAKSELHFAFECKLSHLADAANIRKLKENA